MKIAENMGFKAVFLAGNPEFYERFGFVPSLQHGFGCTLDISEELYRYVMICELEPKALEGMKGKVKL